MICPEEELSFCLRTMILRPLNTLFLTQFRLCQTVPFSLSSFSHSFTGSGTCGLLHPVNDILLDYDSCLSLSFSESLSRTISHELSVSLTLTHPKTTDSLTMTPSSITPLVFKPLTFSASLSLLPQVEVLNIQNSCGKKI